jgi:outer membrane lipoprotein-sorting protein
MATKTTLNTSMVPSSPIQAVSSILDYSPLVSGTETIDGKVCKVITYDDTGAGSMKMWIWEEKGLPLKMEMTSSNGDKTTIDYTNIDFSDIPDSIFELPEGVQIIG